jgi:predicted Zn-dependent protease
MRPNYRYVALFFAAMVAIAFVVFPRGLDIAALYTNSGLYQEALQLLDDLAVEHPDDVQVYIQRAQVLYELGRYDEADRTLKEVVARTPSNLAAWRLLAALYDAMDLPRETMLAFEQIRAVAPADSQALIRLQEYYQWFQMPTQELGVLEALVKRFPREFGYRQDLIDLCIRLDETKTMVAALEGAVAAFPDSVRLQRDLAQAYLDQKDTRALPLFTELQQQDPERRELIDGLLNAMATFGYPPETVVQRFDEFYRSRLEPAPYYEKLALLELVLDDRAAAVRAFEARFALSPDPDIGVQLAQLYQSLNDYDRAATLVGRMVRDHPDHLDLWGLYIPYLATAERKVELVAALEEYRRRWPEDDNAIQQLVDAYDWVGDYEKAWLTVEEILRRDPANAARRQQAARLAFTTNRLDIATAHLAILVGDRARLPQTWPSVLEVLRGLPANPQTQRLAEAVYGIVGLKNPQPGLLLVSLYARLGHSSAAADVRRALATAYPDSIQFLAQFSEQCFQSGQTQQARYWARAALDQDPDYEPALAVMVEVTADAAEAADCLDRLTRRRPDDADLWYRVALQRESQGDSLEALAPYRRMLELSSRNWREEVGFLRQQAHARYRTGDADQALSLLRHALVLRPRDVDVTNDYAEILLARGDARGALEALRTIPEP